jgi:hypothetical protein
VSPLAKVFLNARRCGLALLNAIRCGLALLNAIRCGLAFEIELATVFLSESQSGCVTASVTASSTSTWPQ